MELEVEVEKMFECLPRNPAHSALPDASERSIQELTG